MRYATRTVRLNLGFAAIAVISLALGAGANTAIFQLINAVRLRALPVKAPNELVELRIDDMTHARGSWDRNSAVTNPLWEKIHQRQHSFSEMFAWAEENWNIAQAGEYHWITGLKVSGDFFRALGVGSEIGRVLTADDDHRGCGAVPVAVLSYAFWRQEFGGEASVIGKRLTVGEKRVEVVGVTPASFFGLEIGRNFDIAVPLCAEAGWNHGKGRLDSGTSWWLTVMGRLKPGVSIQQAAADFRVLSPVIFREALPSDYPPESVKPFLAMKLQVLPAGGGLSRLRAQYSTPLDLLLVIAGVVLLIACSNLANLTLARASVRRREIAVRLALGASRASVISHLMIEALLLAGAGAILGLLLAQVLSRFLISFLANDHDRLFVDFHLDWRIFAFTASVAALTCLLFGLIPALRATRVDPGDALKSGSRGLSSSRERLGLRRVFAISQIALSLVLVASAILFVRSLRNLTTLDPGFEHRGILIADVDFPSSRSAPGANVALRDEILERLRNIPGVDAGAEATIVPLTGANWNNRMWMNGSDAGHARVSMRSMIGAGYFRTLKMPLIAGREFDERDIKASAAVAVVNQEFALQFGCGKSPVGKYLWVEATPYAPESSYEIIGVVRNAKYGDLREDFQPVLFTPYSQAARELPGGRFMIRSSTQSRTVAAAVRHTLAIANPEIRYSLHYFDTWIEETLLRERLMAMLSEVFGGVAVVLAMAGIYGVISYTAAQRTNEIGIRVALGADRRRIIVLMFRETMLVLAIGLCVGVILTMLTGRAASALLFGLKSNDPLTLTIAGLSLAIVAMGASYVPAWQAAKVSPVIALKQE